MATSHTAAWLGAYLWHVAANLSFSSDMLRLELHGLLISSIRLYLECPADFLQCMNFYANASECCSNACNRHSAGSQAQIAANTIFLYVCSRLGMALCRLHLSDRQSQCRHFYQHKCILQVGGR